MVTHPNYEPRYSSADAAFAAGVSMDTLKNWVSRKPPAILLTAEEREKVGRGNPILYSVNRIIQIALTAELVGMNFSARRAALAAAAFTDTTTGGHSGGYGGGALDFSGERMPGQLFPNGLTYLVVPPGSDEDAINADLVNVTMETPAPMLLRQGITAYRRAEKATILEVNPTVDRVRTRLAELR